MNLSKIAVGVAASLCLVGNLALAESKPISIEDKMKLKFDDIFQKNDLGKVDPTKKPVEAKKLKALWESYGYKSGSDLLTHWKRLELNDPSIKKDRHDVRDYAIYYMFKFLNDEIDINEKILDKKLNDMKSNNDKINKLFSGKANIEFVEKNTKDITENKKSITVNKSSIEANKSSIEANKKSISEMNAKIELNHKAIQDVKSQLNAGLDNLNKDLRRGLATQSALTGLFQPYSVGKMNVTAAVGGYQSEKAIAVGSGYRFNDNFAAKVGLSKSLGGSAVSYNMGVNYEF